MRASGVAVRMLALLLLASGCPGGGASGGPRPGDATDAPSDGSGSRLDAPVAADGGTPLTDAALARDVAAEGAMASSDGSASVDRPSDLARDQIPGQMDAPPTSDAGRDLGGDLPPGTGRGVTIVGRGLVVDGSPFHIKGVCWNPVARGGLHPRDLNFAAAQARDIPLMRAAGINAVRTYEPLTDRAVLDALLAAGIRVIDTVYASAAVPTSAAVAAVRAVKDHPAILAWIVGNEWNYNGLYAGLSPAAALERVKQVAAAIRAEDATHPVATVYGDLPSVETVNALPEIDLWGLNVYRGIGFGSLFADWAARSPRPMFIAEYGADAWNARLPGEDPASQAAAVMALTELIWNAGAAHRPDGLVAGGALFEWADEWWKDASGSAAVHDIGGIAPGAGPHPDGVFNEEWWGVVDIERNPRPAYQSLKTIFTRQP